MPDNADKALKLAQHVERKLAELEKKFEKLKKDEAEREKAQNEWIKRIEKNLVDAHNAQEKRLTKLHNDQDKRMTELHNKQDKKFVDAHNQQSKEITALRAWVEKTFDKKGFFN